MNTNEDNYFNYTVLSFTYILFSKLLMHIYKITYIYRVSHFNCPPQIFRKLHILEEKVLDKSCRVSRGASNSDLDHDRYHGRQGHFKVKSKFSNGTPLFSHRNWKEEEILRPNMTLTVTSMSRSCQDEIQTS